MSDMGLISIATPALSFHRAGVAGVSVETGRSHAQGWLGDGVHCPPDLAHGLDFAHPWYVVILLVKTSGYPSCFKDS